MCAEIPSNFWSLLLAKLQNLSMVATHTTIAKVGFINLARIERRSTLTFFGDVLSHFQKA